MITVGFDRSENSHAAVLWAAAEARRRNARLRVVTAGRLPVVSDWFESALPEELQPPRHAEDDDELTSLRRELAELHPTLSVEIDLVEGAAWYWLSKPHKANAMVVVGPSAHASETGLWLGGTTRATVRHAECPVIVVHGRRIDVERVVVGVDGSAHSQQALTWAIEEANLHRVPLKVVHVWEYPYARIGERLSPARDLTQVDAARVLNQAMERAREECLEPVDGELLEGSASYFLPTTVEEGDLLVLGRSGRGAIKSALFGSTVASVIDSVPVTVAVVPGVVDDAVGHG